MFGIRMSVLVTSSSPRVARATPLARWGGNESTGTSTGRGRVLVGSLLFPDADAGGSCIKMQQMHQNATVEKSIPDVTRLEDIVDARLAQRGSCNTRGRCCIGGFRWVSRESRGGTASKLAGYTRRGAR